MDKGKITRKQLSPSFNAEIDDVNTHLSEIMNELPVISIENFESYKVAISDGFDYSQCLKAAIDSLPEQGGMIIIPNKEYLIICADVININKTIKILGCGFSSVLKCKGLNIFKTDSNNDHKLIISDVKFDYEGNGRLLHIYKDTNTVQQCYEISKCWFHAQDVGTLISVYGATCNGITSNCFTQNTIDGTAIGIEFYGDGVNGAKNTDVSFNKFRCLKEAIHIEGSANASEYVNTCGFRIISNMMISCATGLFAKNADYIIFDKNMIDYAVTPACAEDVNNFKFRDNYVFTTHTGGTKLVSIKKTLSHTSLFTEISGNYIANGTYNASSNGIESYGIYVEANGQTIDQLNIHDNTFTRLTNAVYLCTSNGGIVSKASIKDNKCANTVNYITLADSNVKNTIVKDNTFDSATVSNNIIDNGVLNSKGIITYKEFNVVVPSNAKNVVVATGIPLDAIIGGFCIYNDSIYYLNPLVTFDSSGSLMLKITTPQATQYTVTVRVSYQI